MGYGIPTVFMERWPRKSFNWLLTGWRRKDRMFDNYNIYEHVQLLPSLQFQERIVYVRLQYK